MNDSMNMKWIFVTGTILLLWILLRHIDSIFRIRSAMRFREWLHIERLTAITKGTSSQELFSTQAGVACEYKFGIELGRRMLHAPVKILSLTGTALTFGGGGLMAALKLMNNRSSEFWSIGLLPCTLGLGLILWTLTMKKRASH